MHLSSPFDTRTPNKRIAVVSAWIKFIPPEEATGVLKALYDKARTPAGTVDNVMRAHSLRPHTMDGHLALYRSVLHNPDNTLPFWFLELIASYTSIVNRCDYSLTHHFANARALIDDDARADAIWEALNARALEAVFDGKELALLNYAKKLTADVGAMENPISTL
jgi:alkylhydroperoxidase family enzyme